MKIPKSRAAPSPFLRRQKKSRKISVLFLKRPVVCRAAKPQGARRAQLWNFHATPILREATTCFCQHWTFSKKDLPHFSFYALLLKTRSAPFKKNSSRRESKKIKQPPDRKPSTVAAALLIFKIAFEGCKATPLCVRCGGFVRLFVQLLVSEIQCNVNGNFNEVENIEEKA